MELTENIKIDLMNKIGNILIINKLTIEDAINLLDETKNYLLRKCSMAVID